MSSSDSEDHDYGLPVSYYKRKKTNTSSLRPGSNNKFSNLKVEEAEYCTSSEVKARPGPASSKSKMFKSLATPIDSKQKFQSGDDPSTFQSAMSKSTKVEARVGPTSSKSKMSKPLTASSKQKLPSSGDPTPSLSSMSKYNLHLQSNGWRIGNVEIAKGYEEYLVKSSFVKMFIRKDGVEDVVTEENDVDDVGSSKDTTRESKFTILTEDLECSSSSEDKDGENNDDIWNNNNENSGSDTSSDEDHGDTNAIKNNNNDDDLSITISSDSEDEGRQTNVETSSSTRSTNVPKKINTQISTDNLKLFYQDYEGAGETRKIRCNLCPGRRVLRWKSFPKHIRNVHEGHERQVC